MLQNQGSATQNSGFSDCLLCWHIGRSCVIRMHFVQYEHIIIICIALRYWEHEGTVRVASASGQAFPGQASALLGKPSSLPPAADHQRRLRGPPSGEPIGPAGFEFRMVLIGDAARRL